MATLATMRAPHWLIFRRPTRCHRSPFLTCFVQRLARVSNQQLLLRLPLWRREHRHHLRPQSLGPQRLLRQRLPHRRQHLHNLRLQLLCQRLLLQQRRLHRRPRRIPQRPRLRNLLRLQFQLRPRHGLLLVPIWVEPRSHSRRFNPSGHHSFVSSCKSLATRSPRRASTGPQILPAQRPLTVQSSTRLLTPQMMNRVEAPHCAASFVDSRANHHQRDDGSHRAA